MCISAKFNRKPSMTTVRRRAPKPSLGTKLEEACSLASRQHEGVQCAPFICQVKRPLYGCDCNMSCNMFFRVLLLATIIFDSPGVLSPSSLCSHIAVILLCCCSSTCSQRLNSTPGQASGFARLCLRTSGSRVWSRSRRRGGPRRLDPGW